MLASVNESRHYESKNYHDEIEEAKKHLATEYDAKNMKPPPLKGIGKDTKAYAFDYGQVLYATKVIKIGPYEVCAGWLVATRPPEQPPSFYVGPCKKDYQSGGFGERNPNPIPTQPRTTIQH